MKQRVVVVCGTRPEAIKLAPVILALREDPAFTCEVCAAAQHREMLDQVLETFGIVPEVDLDLMQRGQTLGSFTARAVSALDTYLAQSRPDIVLVQGDTTTVFCAALVAFYHRIPVGHVEAGLRTGNLEAPWPEEANRVLASRLTAFHFAPTERARDNLLREGVKGGAVVVTGNTVIDALFLALEKARRTRPNVPGLPADWEATWAGKVVLITGHRRESFGRGFEEICSAIHELALLFPDHQFVYPVHLNPHVREPVLRILKSGDLSNLHLLEPLTYLPFVRLMAASRIILTDSGGIQEEAPSLGKPVLVLRETTERPEAVEAGTVRLVGARRDRIVASVIELLTQPEIYRAMSRAHNPYGEGDAAARIIAYLRDHEGPARSSRSNQPPKFD
jgi:UDP-N-acetylglucosamine 2-epimerase (non-hydrolysing)